MYNPMVLMDTTAEKATVLFSMGRPRMKAKVTIALQNMVQLISESPTCWRTKTA